jgi:hypothetical protein
MSQARRALIFASRTGADIALINALEELRILTMWPWQQIDPAPEVSIIIIDRPAPNALKICSNLRSQPQFATVPMLILLSEAESNAVGRFSGFDADVLTKPLRFQALHNYISSMMASLATSELITKILPPDPSQDLPGAVSPYEKETELIGISGAAALMRARDGAEFSLDDVIPTSELLFPMEVAAQAITNGSVLCGKCGYWECRREDSFCAGCGEPLALLSITNEVVSFEPMGSHRVGSLVEMKNNGLNPVRMVFKVDGQIASRFATHTNEAILEAGETGHLLVTLDARNLNLAVAYDAVLEIICNERGRSTRRVKLEVERRALARITPRASYTTIPGMQNRWEFELSNSGGGTLSLARVTLDNMELDFDRPVHVKGGESLTVIVRTPGLDLSIGTHVREMFWEFVQEGPAGVQIAIQAVRQAST